jgi:hypothetical protein
MRAVLKLAGAGVLGIVVAVAILVLALVAYANTKSTTCYAFFRSGDAAGRAGDVGREAGFDVEYDHRGPRAHATFTTPESGADARELRGASGTAVTHERGEPGHPGDGCLERTLLGN